ncbi:MAG: sulfotransferase [Chromatiales bacterium]|jgi:hypothetical protein
MATADTPYLQKIQDLPFSPVFIMGDHRSGTTLLYDLLARTGCFNIVTAYHVIHYGELLRNHLENRTDQAKKELEARFERLGITDRKIDNVDITPDTPEEYAWFLRGIPRLNRLNLGRFTEACRKVQFISGPERPLLLKNPWDYDRNFLRVARLFPDAPIIFIHRNPVDIVNSRLKAARVNFGEKNAYGALISPRYEKMFKRRVGVQVMRFLFSDTWNLGVRITSRHVARAADYYLDHVGELPESRYTWVRYEDLCTSPDESVRGLMEFLRMPAKAPLDLAGHIAPRQTRLLPAVEGHLPRIGDKLARYCEAFDYPIPGAPSSPSVRSES